MSKNFEKIIIDFIKTEIKKKTKNKQKYSV